MDEMSLNNDVTMAGGERALLAGRYRVVKQLGQGGMGSVWRKAREAAERKAEEARKTYEDKETTSEALIIKRGNYSITDGKVTLGKGWWSDQAIPTSTESDFVIPRTIKGYPVTSIGRGAFCHCSALTSVTIPDSVTSIGAWAFHSCSGLASVTIPDGVTSIGREAFAGCSGLKAFTVGTSNSKYKAVNGLLLTRDGESLVAVPGALTSVTIPDSVTSIGDEAFCLCIALTRVTIPDSVTSIGWRAFDGCSKSIFDTKTIPGVKLVGGWAVGYDKTLSGNLSLSGVRGIAEGAFMGCSELRTVIIRDSVTSIGMGAFDGCSELRTVIIRDSVTSIGMGAFDGCSRLTTIVVDSANKRYKVEKDLLLTKDGKTLVSAPGGLSGEVTIPDGVTSIGRGAFHGCSGLASVTIPDSVTSIGDQAFYDCSALTSVTIPDSVTSIGREAFDGCSGLTSVTIPEGVTSIGEGAFAGCSGLTSVTIPDGVTSIGRGAFYECSGLTSVTIPDSVTSIGDSAFYGCSGLTSVTIPDSVTSIGDWAFYGCEGLASVTIPDGVTSIGRWAFAGCSGLTSVSMPLDYRKKTKIGEDAFPKGCRLIERDR